MLRMLGMGMVNILLMMGENIKVSGKEEYIMDGALWLMHKGMKNKSTISLEESIKKRMIFDIYYFYKFMKFDLKWVLNVFSRNTNITYK